MKGVAQRQLIGEKLCPKVVPLGARGAGGRRSAKIKAGGGKIQRSPWRGEIQSSWTGKMHIDIYWREILAFKPLVRVG